MVLTANEHKYAGEVVAKAWRDRDYNLLGSMLAPKLVWHEDAFEEPLQSAEAVLTRWQAELALQSDITVSVRLLHAAGESSYQHCAASYVKDGKFKELDGIFIVKLNIDGKIVGFQQWWSSRQHTHLGIA